MQIENTPMNTNLHSAAHPLDVPARWVSTIFSPLVLIIVMLILITLRTKPHSAWPWTALSIITGILLPLLYIYTQVRRGNISDLDLSDRKQRIGPMLLLLVINFLNLVIMWVSAAPPVLIFFHETGVILLAIMLLITLWWKISGHATAAACFAALLVGSLGNAGMVAVLIPAIVSWSRVHLKRHNRSQVVAGMILGFGFGTLFMVAINGRGLVL